MPVTYKDKADLRSVWLTASEQIHHLQISFTWPRSCSRTLMRITFLITTMMAFALTPLADSQGFSLDKESKATVLRGQTFNLAHQLVADAVVRLQRDQASEIEETRTDANGNFTLTVGGSGIYRLFAEKSGVRSQAITWTSSSLQPAASLQLIIPIPGFEDELPNSSLAEATSLMEFADKPNFTVAGVTDWTAVGGHGTDASVHTSEILTKQALNLKPSAGIDAPSDVHSDPDTQEMEQRLIGAVTVSPQSASANQSLGEFYLRLGRPSEAIPPLLASYTINPSHDRVEYYLALAFEEAGRLSEANQHVSSLLRSTPTADVHRLAAIIYEKTGNPLQAVHEYEIAAKLDPSEENYFGWGSELLLHRALTEAEQVLSTGVKAHPRSSRMLIALGTAFLGGALYDQAAQRLCEASDLNPNATEPYLFLGKLEMISPSTLPCIQPKMARLAALQPDSAMANYYYAMALLKGSESSQDLQVQQKAQALLEKSIKTDPRFGDAYLQLGILSSSRQQLDKALEYYESAIRVNPNLSEAHYRLGLAFDRLHQPEKAKAEFATHDEIEKQQARAIEQQRREIKQFRVTPSERPNE